ncbi:hypothetical protein [Nostoc sp. ATCC 53789]|uniref:hypothetical protein n=1 Tax=Nostoc sp. ATCC 53789 TaxID=76335 RepID=UPI000DECDD8D|nr:hypothetical protein [Nostoc sp. ATCC 53789]QHG15663.1 hypothetical protein GJB62_06565 [Nostoc sp. ATCC 53789]RCJ29387.1 hypothetical protein A6V25_16065 [Nostoc sp. ATCC 53789]
MKVKQLAFRVDQGTYDWLADQAIKKQTTMTAIVQDIFETNQINQMSEGTKKGLKECLEYLLTLDNADFFEGLNLLREGLKELQGVKTNG